MSDQPTVPVAAPAPAAIPPAPKRSATRWITPTLAIVAALAIGLFGGVLIGHNTSASAQGRTATFAARGQNPGPGAGGGFRRFGDFATGTIVSVSDGTIVIKTAAGDQETITTTDKTTVTRTTKSSVGSLKAGQTITVTGTKDASGNLTASSVSEGLRGLRGGFGRAGSGRSNVPTP